ncbi:HNH endonuclease signature motif containing protein [Paracoccus versutus]|uniref:HNH endonuclease signature motif containing protein n=1 Tax=Paracoccus versutus TaxID=34007 RepID=UPI000E23BC03|nr:HNH endonuclease signature motif containing protein [Paracoccus versutus]WGR55669.1 HNH endonuclease [Paracoccus versutus]
MIHTSRLVEEANPACAQCHGKERFETQSQDNVVKSYFTKGGQEITPEILRELIDYDPKTGVMLWKARDAKWFRKENHCKAWNTRRAGKPAGDDSPVHGYRRVVVLWKILLQHRVAWCIHYGYWPTGIIDHINGNKLDNRINNLRITDMAGNAHNLAMSKKNKSGISGVYQTRGKWVAQIGINNKKISLGTFATLEEAAAARGAAEKVLGYHENHGRRRSAEHIGEVRS